MKFDRVVGARLGPDGSAVFGMRRSVGDKNIELPTEQLPNLLLMVLQCISASQGQNRLVEETQFLPAERWEVAKTPDEKQILFSFFVSGAKMSFSLSAEHLLPIRDALSSMAGQAIDIPSEASRQ